MMLFVGLISLTLSHNLGATDAAKAVEGDRHLIVQVHLLRATTGPHLKSSKSRKLARRLPEEATEVERKTSPNPPAPETTSQIAEPSEATAFPLTPIPSDSSEQLLGDGQLGLSPADCAAERVMVHGGGLSARIGRADDFSWPRVGWLIAEANAAEAAGTEGVTRSTPCLADRCTSSSSSQLCTIN
jgi:hypothetical protein